MDDEETGPSISIRRKARPAKGASRNQQPPSQDIDEPDPDTSAVKRRSKPSKGTPTSTVPKSRSSFMVKDPSTTHEPPKDLSQASISSTPVYSKSYLSELKAATPSSSSRTFPDSSYDTSMISMDPEDSIITQESETIIPTSNAVGEAKSKREYLRKHGTDPFGSASTDYGYIPLDVATMPEKSGESRLVREDDELGEGDDEHPEYTGAQETVPLGRKATKANETLRRRGMQEMIEDAEDEVLEEDDPEARKWEEAQLKAAAVDRFQREPQHEKVVYKPAPIPEPSGVPNLDFVHGRLANSLANLERSHNERSELLESTNAERIEIEKQDTETREQLSSLNEKYGFFSDFRDWVEDVANFLEVKRGMLDQVMQDNIKFQKERLDIIHRRRLADDADDLSLCTGVHVASPLFQEQETNDENGVHDLDRLKEVRRSARKHRKSRRSSGAADQEDAGNDDAFSTDDQLNEDDATDLSLALHDLNSSIAAIFKDVESMEYLDPAQGVSPRFAEWRRSYPEIYRNAFAGLAMVGVLEFWTSKEMTPWNPFGTPGLNRSASSLLDYQWHYILSAYAEQASGEDSMPPNAEESEDNLVSAMVEKGIVEQLRLLAATAYDPLSARATRRALESVEEVAMCIDPAESKFKTLIRTFLGSFQVAITLHQNLIIPHLSSIASPQSLIGEEGIQARNRVLHRGVKLLTNALRWKKHAFGITLPDMIADPMKTDEEDKGDKPSKTVVGGGMVLENLLRKELLEKCILPVIEAGWETGGRGIAVKILAMYAPLGGTSFALPEDLSKRLRGMTT